MHKYAFWLFKYMFQFNCVRTNITIKFGNFFILHSPLEMILK